MITPLDGCQNSKAQLQISLYGLVVLTAPAAHAAVPQSMTSRQKKISGFVMNVVEDAGTFCRKLLVSV